MLGHCLPASKTIFASSARQRYVILMAFRWRANDDPLRVVFGSLPSSTKTMDQVNFKQSIHLERLARMMKFFMMQVYQHAWIQSGGQMPAPTPVGIWILWTITKQPSQHLLLPTREPLYSNSTVIAWWLQSTSAQIMYLAFNKGNILVNFLLLKIFIANYYHL